MQPGKFAQYAHVGTWSDGRLCPDCGITSERLIPPLQIEWEPGTENIGDFAWCGFTCVVKATVRNYLSEFEFECSYASVEIKEPSERTRAKRVPFPYTGPKLYWLRPNFRVPLNESASGVYLKRECKTCGVKQYNFKQVGLIVSKQLLGGKKIFQIRQFRSSAIFLTEDAIHLLNQKGFSGYKLIEAGEIIN